MRALLALLLTGCYAAHERAPMCTDEDEPSELPHYGIVSVGSETHGIHEDWGANAFFGEASLAEHDATEIRAADIVARAGDCVAVSAGADIETTQDAGDVLVTDGDRLVTTAHVAGGYHDAGGDGPVPIAAGDIVQLTLSGGVVPPAAGCVAMPGTLDHVVLPYVWAEGEPFVVTWDPGIAAETAELSLGEVVPPRIDYIFCRVAPSAGRIEIPAELRSAVPDGAASTLTLARSRVVRAGDYAIRMSATRSITSFVSFE